MSKLHRLFFFLTTVFLPTQLGRHFWPEWASVLGRRVDYLSPTLYLTDILIILTIIFWFISSLSRFKNYDLRITKRNIINHKSLFIILSALFVCINIYVAGNKLVTVYFWLKVLEFAAFGYYIIKTKLKLSDLTPALAIAIFYSATLAIIQFFLQRSIGGPLWFLGERSFTNQTPGIAQMNVCFQNCRLLLRPYATFPHPNVLGGFLAITIPLIISNFQFQISNRGRTFPLFKVITVIIGCVALLLTFSRSAWLVGSLGMVWVFVPKKLKAAYTLCTIAIFIVGIFVVKDFAATSESVVVREQLNSSAVALWQHSPLFGIGLGNFLVNLPSVLPSRTIYFLQPVHNIYLLILSELGIVGLLSFFWCMLIIFRVEFRIQNSESKPKNLYSMNHILLTMLLLLGLVDHYLLTLQQGQLLFTILLALSFQSKMKS